MDKLILCTGNAGKTQELQALLPSHITLFSLADVDLPHELPETGNTLEANALQKARFAHARTGLPCVADDTGLEVDALGGAPGVFSARYAGEARNAQANMTKLLDELKGHDDRSARFRTVLALITDKGEVTFEGKVEGTIGHSPKGANGFGYDPIFIPEGYSETFAEIEPALKNSMSHRGRAVQRLLAYLSGA
jgi:XTP/dITP diphosphohydrolase